MASNFTSIIPAAFMNDAAAPAVRRSRFSFHLNTPRRRRWLLVQLVSVADDSTTREEAAMAHAIRSSTPRPSIGSLVDQFCTSLHMQRRV